MRLPVWRQKMERAQRFIQLSTPTQASKVPAEASLPATLLGTRWEALGAAAAPASCCDFVFRETPLFFPVLFGDVVLVGLGCTQVDNFGASISLQRKKKKKGEGGG
jgi:hypothetical protein